MYLDVLFSTFQLISNELVMIVSWKSTRKLSKELMFSEDPNNYELTGLGLCGGGGGGGGLLAWCWGGGRGGLPPWSPLWGLGRGPFGTGGGGGKLPTLCVWGLCWPLPFADEEGVAWARSDPSSILIFCCCLDVGGSPLLFWLLFWLLLTLLLDPAFVLLCWGPKTRDS